MKYISQYYEKMYFSKIQRIQDVESVDKQDISRMNAQVEVP